MDRIIRTHSLEFSSITPSPSLTRQPQSRVSSLDLLQTDSVQSILVRLVVFSILIGFLRTNSLIGIPVAAITGILAYAMYVGFTPPRTERLISPSRRLGAVSLPGAVVFLLLYGLASGAWVTIFTPLFMSLAIDSSEIGTRAGVGYFFVSLATLVGTPIAGALLAGSGTYTAPVLFSGSAALVGSSILVVFRGRQVAKKGNWKC